MDREEHLAFAKEHALAYLPGDIASALSSFISDLEKHEELKDHAVLQQLIAMHIMAGLVDEHTVYKLIEGTR